ncbi:diguanylate cyclase [Pseudidiomarina halophila]|uniref:diguanylate cyclase n=1 Tax=Pseudidiomarina halophila TaxID=1449799 RepID=UPI0036091302
MIIRKRVAAVIIIVFLAGLFLVWGLANWVVVLTEERLKQDANDNLRSEVLLAKSKLESALFRDVFLVDSLATLFNIDPQASSDNFHEISTRLLDRAENVRNVGMAPNDIVEKNYPIEGNEKAIGLDFRTVPSQYETVQAARRSEDIYIAGPLELFQGGQAIIARVPVFTDYPANKDYWGSLSVVIDYKSLMSSAGIFQIKNADIAIRGRNGTGREGEIFEGTAETFQKADYQGVVIIPNGEWWIAAKFESNLTQEQNYLMELERWSLIGIYILLFFSVFVLWTFYRAERHRANEDVLTRLYNRRFALRYLHRLLSENYRSSSFCVLAIDLNGFKEINDTHGHDAGDEMLKLVANGLEAAVRASDIVARMGGDEFLVILNRCRNQKQVDGIIEKIRNFVESQSVQAQGLLSIRHSASAVRVVQRSVRIKQRC